MIYGKLTLEDWHNVKVQGETPESIYESHNLRLFFYGSLYNRDILRATSQDTNAKLVAEMYLKTGSRAFSLLDGSFTIVYYSESECGIVRDHHGTHYPVYYADDGSFATSWLHLRECAETASEHDFVSLSRFLQRGIIDSERFVVSGIHALAAGGCIKVDKDRKQSTAAVIQHSPQVIIDKNPDVESFSRRYGELHAQAIRRRIGDSRRVGILLSGGYDSGSNLAALRSVYDGVVDSYSVGFKGDTWTELPLARLMSKTFDTRHHEYEIDGSELEIVIYRIILYKASRMARMFGNNLTFPFMDLEFYKFLQTLPVGLKCKDDSTLNIARGHSISKYLLKYHYKPQLPEAITSKKKQGGFAPMPLFFKDSIQRARLKEFILSSGIFDSYLCRDAVEKFLADYDREAERTDIWFWHRQNRALQYFNLLTLVTWWEEFVEKHDVRY